MIKKLTLLAAVAVTALVALAIPVAAQAEPIVTNSLGEDATELTAVSTNLKTTTAAGTLECGTVDLQLTGGTGHYQGAGYAVGAGQGSHSGPCKSSSGLTLHVDSFEATIQLNGGGTGTIDFTYTYRITSPSGALHCDFNASGGAVTYAPTSSEISISTSMTGSGLGCATTGNTNGTFAVTSEGESVSIH